MSFYKEIAPFVEYIHSIRKLESYLSFDMKFQQKWSIPKSIVDEGQVIGFEVELDISEVILELTPTPSPFNMPEAAIITVGVIATINSLI